MLINSTLIIFRIHYALPDLYQSRCLCTSFTVWMNFVNYACSAFSSNKVYTSLFFLWWSLLGVGSQKVFECKCFLLYIELSRWSGYLTYSFFYPNVIRRRRRLGGLLNLIFMCSQPCHIHIGTERSGSHLWFPIS